MILFFYNLALLLALALGSPWWLWRMATTRKYREGLAQRLGRVRALDGQGGRPLIWIHAVSVGEVLAVSRLVRDLDAALPDHFIAISTTTRTGQELARERFGVGRVFYCPLDLPWAVRAYLDALRPRLLVLAETEFWPNLLSGCYRRQIPVAVVNARVSDRSWPRYRRLRWLWRPFLERLSRVLAQSSVDAERLVVIGCRPERVTVAGNLKFDVRAAEEAEATRLLRVLAAGLRFVVAGSTLDGEETALLEAWPRLLEADPALVLVLAPRHPERFGAVEALLDMAGVAWAARSDWRADSGAGTSGRQEVSGHDLSRASMGLQPTHVDENAEGSAGLQTGCRVGVLAHTRHAFDRAVSAAKSMRALAPEGSSSLSDPAAAPFPSIPRGSVILLDTIGELGSVYSLAAVAFVGGSLVAAGGHNALEPARFGVPIVMGPHYANFRAITEDLRTHDAIRIVAKVELAAALIELLRDPTAARAMGERAREVFEAQAGATDRCVRAIDELLGERNGAA